MKTTASWGEGVFLPEVENPVVGEVGEVI